MSFKLAFIGCDTQRYFSCADAIIESGAIAAFLQGDTPYIGNLAHFWSDVGPTDLALDDSVTAFLTHYDEYYANPGLRKLMATVPIYIQWDDHEWMGNDWDHTISAAERGTTPLPPGQTQAMVNQHWKNGRDALIQVVNGRGINPMNTDVGPNTVIPSAALNGDTPPASNYPIGYWRQGFTGDGTMTSNLSEMLVQVYSIDNMSYRDPVGSDGTMLGSQQKAWLLDQVQAAHDAGVPFQLIASSKNWYQTRGGNPDSWEAYPTERAEIITEWNVRGFTGLGWVSNDQHRHKVDYTANGVIADMCPGPVNQTLNSGFAKKSSELYKSDYPDGDNYHMAYGLVEFTAAHMEFSIRAAGTDTLLYAFRISLGTNVPVPYVPPPPDKRPPSGDCYSCHTSPGT